MPINEPRKDYAQRLPEWTRLRDCFNGRDAILKAGNKYIPDLIGMEPLISMGNVEKQKNEDYRKRGSFYNATNRTIVGLIGGIFQKEPVFDVPSNIEPLLDDITLTNVSMEMFALQLGHETMLTGRYGILVDMPTTGEVRPYLVGYNAEDIVNWRVQRIDGDEILTMVVLRETAEVEDDDDEFCAKTIIQYRCVKLKDGLCVQQLYREDTANSGVYAPFGEEVIPQRRGEALDFIPFVCVGTEHVSIELCRPPLLDLADVNLGHWRNSVDYEYGLHLVALPTPWVSGSKGSQDGPMKVGPSVVWELELQGSAGMLEFTGKGLEALVLAMQEKKQQMATLGARMIDDPPKMNETATAVMLRHSGDYASLRTIAQAMEQGISMALQIIDWWEGLADTPVDTESFCELNKEFSAIRVDPLTVQAALTAVQADEMSFETFYNILQTGGWARDGVDVEQERADIEKQIAARPAPVALPLALPPADPNNPTPPTPPTPGKRGSKKPVPPQPGT